MGRFSASVASVLCVCVLAALAGCSSEKNAQPSIGKIAYAMAKARLNVGAVETTDATKAKPQVTRAQMKALGRPVVFVTVPRFGTALPAVELAKNGPYTTYMDSSQSTVTLQNGIVTATRGQIVDLIGQSLSVPEGDLFRGQFPKSYGRTQRQLNGESILTTTQFTCVLSPFDQDETLDIFGQTHIVRQFSELCRNKVRAFKNSYWVEKASGIVWQSHQSISKEVGHVIVQRVIP